MNKEFMIKIMQAKKLEYEALKSVLPEKMSGRIEKVEKEIIEIAKDFAVAEFCSADLKEQNPQKKEEKKVKKVSIES